MKENMIRQIFHISDVHIRLYHRYKQYSQVLQQLIDDIQKRKVDGSLIVITGDLFHSKTELSPESIHLASQFLLKLSNTLPTIIIAGNHDANLSNKHRLDALSPIIKLLNIDNLYYYRDTGWYQYENINFYVNSVFDQKLPTQYPSTGINIGLYHGILSTPAVYSGVKLPGKYSLEDFSKFDFVLLGDIHKSQVLSQNPIISYAGSLLQLNYGEDIHSHGYMLWDLEARTTQHIEVLNQYAYYNIQVVGGQIINMPEIKASHPRFKIKYSNTTISELKYIQNMLRQKFSPDEIMLSKNNDDQLIKSSTFKFNLDNIDDPAYQETIIRQYIKHAELGLTQQNIQQVLDINLQYNTMLRTKRVISQYNIWSLKKFEFSNFFSYGENNVIQFDKYYGLVGICGANRSGKSSIVDSILFMLYDRTSKTNKAINILNNEKNDLYGRLQILLNNKLYVIEKYGTRNLKHDTIAIKCRFFTYDDNGEVLDLSGTQRSDTVRIIQEHIGTYQDLNSTSFSTQGNSNRFLESTSTNRKTLLNSLLNLTIFDKCNNEVNQKTKQMRGYLNSIDYDRVTSQIETLQKKLKERNLNITSLKVQKSKLIKDIEKLQSSLKLLISKKKQQTIDNINIQQVQISINTCQNSILIIKNNIDTLNKTINEANSDIDQIQALMDLVDIDSKRALLLQHQKQHQIYKNDLSLLKHTQLQLQTENRKLQLLKDLQYDVDCEYCMNNPLTKDAIQSKTKVAIIKSQIQQLKVKIAQYQTNKLQIKNKIVKEINIYDFELRPLYNASVNTKTSAIEKILLQQQKLHNYQQELASSISQSVKYYQNNKIIQDNKLLIQRIKNEEKQLNAMLATRNSIESDILEHTVLIATETQKLHNNKDISKKYNQVNNQFIAMQRYKSIIGRTGIQYYITYNIISVLQQQINIVLQMISNFNIEFVLQGKSLDINIIYPNKKYQVETCSGFEQFIISLAIRYALSTMTNKSKAKLFVIDEGFGVMDAENINQLHKILLFLSEKYETLFVISHLDTMRSMFDTQLQIQYKEGYSRIV